MSRKTHRLGLSALAAIAATGFVAADFSGATAQANDQLAGLNTPSTTQSAAGSEELVPAFVSQEVVQPLPSEDAASNTDADAPVTAKSLSQLVATTAAPETLSDEMQCLAGAVYFESRGEPLDGQLAVAQVIINRTESGSFPSSYCGVVYQRSQFSFVKGGQMPRIRTSSEAWRRAKTIARIAHEGLWDSAARDSLYFHADYVRPSWSRQKVARATINTHIFYR